MGKASEANSMNYLTGKELEELQAESEEIQRNARAAYLRKEISEADYLAICRRAAVVEA